MLTREEFKSLGQIRPLKPILDILICWGGIVLGLWLIRISIYYLPLSLALIATRLHGLIIIMHDGAHYLIHTNKAWNDRIANWLCSFPLQISTEAYRQTHAWHHSHTQTLRDPNYLIMRREEAWKFPKRKSEVKRIILRDLILLTLRDHLLILKDWQVLPNWTKISKTERISFVFFVTFAIGIIALFGVWKDLLVFQMAALFINPIVRIRAMSEHIHREATGQSKKHKLQETPTINANWIERLIISPFNTNRHLEHHLFPTIPYYNLERVHAAISRTTFYKQHCLFELDGYFLGKRTSLNEVLSHDEEGGGEINSAA